LLGDFNGLRVFCNRALRKMLGPKRKEACGVLKKLHNEELGNAYSSPNIIRLINSRRIRRTGKVTGM
jgi:hypothetical protein